MNTSIFQFLLFIFNKIVIPYVVCERMESNKVETKVEIEVTYLYRQYNDKSSNYIHHTKPIHKIVQFTYNIPNLPKTITSELRNTNRQTNTNNNLRHGFRFSTIEKSAGAFTMSSSDNDNSETGLRVRNNIAFSGKLIHVVSLPDQATPGESGVGNSSVLSWSHNACHDTVNSVQGSWVALVQSGSCPVERKVRQIMKLQNHPVSILIYGSSQVIIKHDSFLSINQDDTPMVIFLPWNNIQGVVQKCFNSSGQILLPAELLNRMNRSSYDWPFSNQNQCNVTIKVYSTSDDTFLNRTSVLFVSISFILLMVISLAWLMFYYVQRFRYIHTKEQFSRRLAHMAKKAVAKIPVKTIKQGDKETDAEMDNCAICIECYKPSDTVRILPCKHYFHKSCIDPWLLEQRSCPMCKLNILHAYGFLPNERGSMISEDRLSELDSSLELQFLPGTALSPLYAGPSSLIQAHCQPRDSLDSAGGTASITTGSPAIPLPSIFTESVARGGRWASLRLKRAPLRSTHHIDRCASLRHLGGSAEERTTFLPRKKLLSQSATDNIAQDAGLTLLWPGTTAANSTSCARGAADAAVVVLIQDSADLQSEASLR